MVSGFQFEIVKFNRRTGMGRAFALLERPGDHAQSTGPAFEIDGRDVVVENRLIAWRRHFRGARQVYPQLNGVKRAALFCKFLFVELLVHDTGCRGHPLDIAWADHTGISCRVPMG